MQQFTASQVCGSCTLSLPGVQSNGVPPALFYKQCVDAGTQRTFDVTASNCISCLLTFLVLLAQT
jgi:hypothetical protein